MGGNALLPKGLCRIQGISALFVLVLIFSCWGIYILRPKYGVADQNNTTLLTNHSIHVYFDKSSIVFTLYRLISVVLNIGVLLRYGTEYTTKYLSDVLYQHAPRLVVCTCCVYSNILQGDQHQPPT